ncbi:RcnB family protein [Poseidonocella sp. HB161398]|uniref:RcnB family protein n=1 Tax=Poseidonocella sp. HB161398 TaxID=2320855 RepID=UPI00148746B6|nr:RcnB family protein [Poseidonocella sp. HB161398]
MLKKTLATTLCIAVAAMPALADPHKKDKGWKKHEAGHHERHRDDRRDGGYWLAGNNGHGNGNGNGRWVPPGLDKKPGNMPPGQYKKIHGQHVDWHDYRLPRPPDGQIYVRQGDQLYRVMRDTMIVAAALGVISQYLK